MQVIDYLINKIRATAANFNSGIQTAPACILWLDSENQWTDATQTFLTKLPELLVLGEYCPEKHTGPAIWLRGAIARKTDEIQLPSDRTPIIYLSGIGRQDLRADKIKEALRPLAELQYRSVVWSQINSKDWTVLAFLKSDQGGLGLDVAQDNDTKNAMLRALDPLLDMDIEALKGERLDKDFFNSIYAGDYVRLVLQWLDQGDSFKTNLGEKRWQAFVEMCESKLTFNPDKDGPLSGAIKLTSRDSQWQPVWDRFCEAPKRYPHIPKKIRNCKPPASMDWYSPGKTTYNRWPQWNDAQESSLRKSLSDIDNNPPLNAREKIMELEKEHRSRRNLIWAELCEAPLAQALEHLAVLAETTAKRLVVGSAGDLMKEYQNVGWQADDAVLQALIYVEKQQDIEVITKSIRAIYIPWAEESARYLQKVIDEKGYPLQHSDKQKDSDHKNGDCILFVDGLRFDAAKRLAGKLKVCGYQVEEKPVWAPLPTVTSTGKPAVSPIKNRIAGKDAANSFEPSVADTGQSLNGYYLKKLLIEAGWQILEANQSGDVNGNAWIEFGDIDCEGHERGWKIAKQIDAILNDIRDQVIMLLNSGWKKIKIVTDHGWLLVPGDLQKIELPSAQTATKSGRCAAIKSGAVTDGQLYPWYWNPNQHFALANGISCFRNGTEYDHGGISLQECVVIELEVSPSASHTFHITPEITDVAWKGLRCTIAADSVYEGLALDIRTQPGDPTSSIVVRTQPLKENGTASVVVENEDLEDSNSTIVLINQKGELVAQIDTIVGGEEKEMTELDQIDQLAASALDGYLVRKDLVRAFSRQFPVPTYVVEFLLGRYCASINQKEINEGLEIVQRQLESRTVKAGEEELFKSRARENGEVKLIDLITARLDAKTDSYMVTLPSLQLIDARIPDETVRKHERMLTGGFYAEITLSYDAAIAQENKGRPFGVENLREIQLSKHDILDILANARKKFTTEEWKSFLLRSVGIEQATLSERAKNALLLRMVPFVERNYNQVELGPRGTGKSHLFQQISPYSHLISGGKATVAKMFVNNSTGQRGLVCQYDVVCFDEISGISFDQKDGVNIMKGYMESGEFSRGKESIRADGSIVMVGNFEVDVEHQQRIGHLFGPLPEEIRNDTAFMDRIHAYLPGWDVPKIGKELLTNHFGLVSDFLSECWSQLRNQSRLSQFQGKVLYGGALSPRDANAVNKTVSGLLKLLYPAVNFEIPEEEIEWALRIALEARRRVKEQQKRIGSAEFRNTHFSYVLGVDGVEKFVSTPELQSENSIGGDPLEPGQVWTISPDGVDEHPGLYKIEVNEGPGSGLKILNKPIPPAFRESVSYAEQNLYARSVQLVGDKDPRNHEFAVQLRAYDVSKSGAKLGMATLIALCTSLLKKNVRGGLVIVGEIALGGSIEPLNNSVSIAEIAVEKGATSLLMPITCRRQLIDLPDDMATKIAIQFYSDARDALVKAIEQ